MSGNPIWNFFEKGESKGTCLKCKTGISLGSMVPKKQTTSSLKKHLMVKHPDDWQEFQYINEGEIVNAREQRKEIQLKIPQCTEKLKKWPDDSEVSMRIDKSIIDLILVDMLPYNIVNGAAFRRLNFIDPALDSRYNLKSEKFFRDKMGETYIKVKNKIKEIMLDAKWISFTTDIWSSHSKTVSLLSFTAHFIKESTREKIILAAAEMNEDHTAVNIYNKLSEVINEFQIGDRIHVAVGDNARNMKAGIRNGKMNYLGCVAHTLQLVIHDSFQKSSLIMELIKKCRTIIGYFKRSEHASRHLKILQENSGVPVHTLLQDISTRWNSTFIMWERLLEQRVPLTLFAAEKGGIPLIVAEEWELMSQLISILESFYEATLDISSDTACVSITIPLIDILKSKLQTNDGSLIEFKNDMHSSLCSRFGYLSSTPFIVTATILDPRFKDKYLNDSQVTLLIIK